MDFIYNDKTFPVTLRPTCGAVHIELENLENRRSSYERTKAGLAVTMHTEGNVTDPALAPIVAAARAKDITLDEAARLISNEFTFADIVRYMRVIIDRKKLTPEQTRLIDSEFTISIVAAEDEAEAFLVNGHEITEEERRELAKIDVLKYDSLSVDQKALLERLNISDFWLQQDSIAMRREVFSFREKFNF